MTVGLQAEEALVVVDWYGYSYLVDGGAAGVQLAVQGVGDDGEVVISLDDRVVLGHVRDADEGRGAQFVADVGGGEDDQVPPAAGGLART